MTILVGDVGGTNVRLALVDGGEELRIRRKRVYDTDAHDGLAPVVARYRRELPEDRGELDRAAFGVACPVVDGTCRLPNADWELREDGLAEAVGVSRVLLINDFDAVCHALPHLKEGDTVPLREGVDRPSAPLAVVGAGTGLGHGFVTREGGYRVHSSEGGHADFAPRDELECELQGYLRDRYDHASWERVVSGPGLVDLYRFLITSGREEALVATREAMEEDDPAAVVSERARSGEDPACQRALELFVSLYGAMAGNFVLCVQAFGGLYVAGGIAPRILERLRDGPFVESFLARGRLAAVMEDVPVRVIVEKDVGLLGAAAAALGRPPTVSRAPGPGCRRR